MKKSILLFLALILCQIGISQTFKIDSEHTAITTKVQRFSMVDVVGRFNSIDGQIIYDEDVSKISANVTISTDSYTSNNTAGEGAVKSPAFLDVAKYPSIQFKKFWCTEEW